MTDDLIRWSHCSPVRLYPQRPEPKVEVREHKAPEAKGRDLFQAWMLAQQRGQQNMLNSQLRNNLFAQQMGVQQQFGSGGLLGGLFGRGL